MSRKTAESQKKRQPRLSPRTLQRWRGLVHDLPDIRLEKVQATREALKNREYDSEEILEETIRRLREELGILCHRALKSDAHWA